MPRHTITPSSCLPADHKCPRCNAETEPIEVSSEGLAFQQLQLCPACYLVTWRDEEGFHVRQGVPMKDGARTGDEPGGLSYLDQQRPALC